MMNLYRFGSRCVIYRVYNCTVSNVSAISEASSRNAKNSVMCCLRRNMNGMTKSSKENRAKIDLFVKTIAKKGIKLVAINFNRVLININTMGVWDDGLEKLVPHVRPCMVDLLESTLSTKGLYAAIVTYHRQRRLIEELLGIVLSKKLSEQIYVATNNREFLQMLQETGQVIYGKETHIGNVVVAIKRDHKVKVKDDEILLIDDRAKNIRIALESGHYAIQVKDDIDYSTFANPDALLQPMRQHTYEVMPGYVLTLPAGYTMDLPEYKPGGKAKANKEGRAKIDSFVKTLTKKGIKLLAIDFDKTLIDIHTKGKWQGSAESLASHVRPCMRDLMASAASREGLYVAIVTYNKQFTVISEVLFKLLPKEMVQQMYIQANDSVFLQELKDSGVPIQGKEQHLQSVVGSIEREHNVKIDNEAILLLDDDIQNIRCATEGGHYAFQITDSVDYSTFAEFEEVLLSAAVPHENRAKIDSFVKALSKKGIKLVAVDFDETFVDITTDEKSFNDLIKLSSHVRPCMLALLKSAVSSGLYASVIHYTIQPRLLMDLLEKMLPNEICEQIYVPTNDAALFEKWRNLGGPIHGIELHLEDILERIKLQHKVDIKDDEIILVDDNSAVIKIAREAGHYAFYVDDDIDYSTFAKPEAVLLLPEPDK